VAGETPAAPDIRNGDLMTPVVRAVAASHWGVPISDREYGMHRLRDVYVVGEGLVFDRALNLINSSVFQTTDDAVRIAHGKLLAARASGAIPTHAGVSLLCGKSGLNNYGHWMVEMAPCVHVAMPWILTSGWNVLVPCVYPHMEAVIGATLDLLGVPVGRAIKGVGEPMHFDEIIFMPDFSAHGKFYPPAAMGCMDALARGMEPGVDRKVWISRVGDPRSLVEEATICAALASRGWRIIEPAKLTLREQIAVAKGARHMAGVVGAGLTNFGFMAAGGRVTGFMPANMPDVFFYHLASMRGLRYREVRAPVVAAPNAPEEWNGVLQISQENVLAHLETDDE
jgi:capsular polysaccharide biosynthesis protein